jgi:hypothetical protein
LRGLLLGVYLLEHEVRPKAVRIHAQAYE